MLVKHCRPIRMDISDKQIHTITISDHWPVTLTVTKKQQPHQLHLEDLTHYCLRTQILLNSLKKSGQYSVKQMTNLSLCSLEGGKSSHAR